MNDMRSRIVCLIALLFALPVFAQAKVVINEIQISPTESRFIELYNNGSSAVDLTGYYIQRKTENGSSWSSLVTSTNFDSKSIAAGGYFLISRSALPGSDIVLGSLTITESNSLQLKNSSGEVVDKVCFSGAGDCADAIEAENPNEGQSITRNGSAFSVTAPSPGVVGGGVTNNSDTSGADDFVEDNSSTESSSTTSSEMKPTAKFEYQAPVFIGIPVGFTFSATGTEGKQQIYGNYVVNFGDGVEEEFKANHSMPIYHTYFYPNDYLVTLEYYAGDYVPKPNATFKQSVRVIPASVVVSKTGEAPDFFVELANGSKYDVDISKWKLIYNGQLFILPRNTTLLKNQKLALGPRVTGFTYASHQEIGLFNTSGDLVSSFNIKPQTSDVQIASISPVKRTIENVANDTPETAQLSYVDLTVLPDYNLARASSAQATLGKWKFYLMLVLLLAIAVMIVYFLRKKGLPDDPEEDFEILDE